MIKWYFDKAYLWGRSILELDPDDQILASFPKTGSTWIRYFLYTLLSQRLNNQSSSIDSMNSKMPEFANKNFFNKWIFTETPRIVKTHQKGLGVFKNNKVALIVRDPRDIVISYYNYLNGLRSSNSHGSLSQVMRDNRVGFKPFFNHFDSWRNSAKLILRYEDLKNKPNSSFAKLATFFDIKRNSDEIASAIKSSNFANMRIAQEKSQDLMAEFKEGHQFLRAGRTDQWRDLFTVEDIEYYESLKDQHKFYLYE